MLSMEPTSNLLIQDLKTVLNSSGSDALRIVELGAAPTCSVYLKMSHSALEGAGTGIVSICLSTLLQRAHSSRHTQILATDLRGLLLGLPDILRNLMHTV
jgi:hypothetical protein